METKRLKTRTAFATDIGVSRARVTKLCQGKLARALVGKKIDIDHSTVIEYLLTRQNPTTKKPLKQGTTKPTDKTTKSTARASTTEKKIDKPKRANEPENTTTHYPPDADMEKVLDLTLRELTALHGTDEQFKVWVSAVKTVGDIRHKDLKLAEMEGTLIPRELVRTHVFGALDSGHLRLLTDSPKTLARRIEGAVKSGSSLEEIESLIREHLSIQLKGMKTKAQRVLKNA